MTAQPLPLRKAILEKPRQQRLVLGERHNAVAYIARSRDVQLLAQTAAGTSIIGDRHDGRQIGYAGKPFLQRSLTAGYDVLLQAVQHSGQASASSHGDNSHGPQLGGFGIVLHQTVGSRAAKNATSPAQPEIRRWYQDKAAQ